MALAPAIRDVELVISFVVSGAYCVPCIAGKTAIPTERVTAAFRLIEEDWQEPLIDTALCAACHATTTVYSLRLP